MEKNDNPPQPIEEEDFYIGKLRRYIISIEVYVDAFDQMNGTDIISQAITGFREGELDGNASIMHSELIHEVELDFNSGLPFNRKEWEIKELKKQGLNEKGVPLSPSEKTRPKEERRIFDFI